MNARATLVGLAVLTASSCRAEPGSTVTLPADPPSAPVRRDESPVALDPDPGVDYPAALADQRIGGTVVLRLFADAAGRVIPESTKVQESSGYPALDSAALRAAPSLRYAPALRNGRPTAGPFLQPFNFRARGGGATFP